METSYTIRVHDEGDGSLWAEVVELPGCFASGDTYDELLESLREAISMVLGHDVEKAEWTSLPAPAVLERHLLVV